VSSAVLDGITTRYEVEGSGPPLLMFSPGGFNAVAENWTSLGVYAGLGLLDQLPEHYTCIRFDRREAGASGGRVEHVTWDHYVAQGRGLLDHLGIERAHLMGGCVGCSVATALAVRHPERVSSMVLYSPAGGPRYRMTSRARFEQHLAYAAEHGLDGVLALARITDEGFSKDPRLGPWVSVLRNDPAFAAAYAALDPQRYQVMVTGLARTMFDRDTVPGPEPEELMLLDVPTLIIPGEDRSHAPSAARYLEECVPGAQLWDVPVADQTAQTAPARIHDFLSSS
jgi:pimeloyl-ACP methyl ester carboxylesterase